MEESLLRYIWKHTWRQQLWILLIVSLSMIPYFLSFDLPKQIINGPIQGGGFSNPDSLQRFLHLVYEVPLLGRVEIFEGIELNRPQALVVLSVIFLAMVVLNGAFKLYINTYKGRLGERMLRRIRFELVDRVLRFPPWYFSRVKSAEVATMVKDEVEPLGGFTGDVFVQPAFLSGQALTTLVFIIIQNVWLGMIATGMIIVQAILIPRMRKRLLQLSRQRQLTARELSGRVGEIVDGISAIHGNDTSNLERADIAWRLGRIFSIRYELYQWKFLVKFINNFLAQVTPFFFYVIGGYFVLLGRLDLGQLVAVIAAYKDLPGPLKDLIDWDQARQDMQVKYAQVYQQFSVEPMLEKEIQAVPSQPVPSLRSALVVRNLSITDESGARLLENVTTEIAPNRTVAVVGSSGSGAQAFAEALGRLVWPTSGTITIDGTNMLDLPESITGRRISYVSSETFFLHSSLRDNLLYGLKHAPIRPASYDGKAAEDFEWHAAESLKAGNPVFDLNCDWVDYQAAGAGGPDELAKVVGPVLDAVLISEDIFDLALRTTVDAEAHPRIAGQVVQLRVALRERLAEEELGEIIVPFDFDLYNRQATVIENLLFGTLSNPGTDEEKLIAHPHFQKVLQDTGLEGQLHTLGRAVAENVVELFQDLPAGHPFFQQLTFMTADDIPVYQEILQRAGARPAAEISAEDREKILRLSFSYVEPRHRFGLMNDALSETVVAARKRLLEDLPEDLVAIINRHDPSGLAPSATLLDNIVYGRVVREVADARDRIRAILRELFLELGLQDEVISIGLGFDVGSGGKRLTMVQRQKLNLARALLRRSDYFIFNQPLSALDRASQEQITHHIVQVLHKEGHRPAIVWVLSDPGLAELFDDVLVFQRGTLADSGSYRNLHQDSEIFRQLTA